jgi:hypothetical protein
MTSPDPLAEHLAEHPGAISRLKVRMNAQVRAVAQGPRLDSELAEGVSPSSSPAHLARADRITSPRVRRRVAGALNRAIEESFAPAQRLSTTAPLSEEAIRTCREQLITLARQIVAVENPRVQAVAIASQLAFDGRGALFFQPNEKSSVERLANTIRAALSALRVSGEFDRARRPVPGLSA